MSRVGLREGCCEAELGPRCGRRPRRPALKIAAAAAPQLCAPIAVMHSKISPRMIEIGQLPLPHCNAMSSLADADRGSDLPLFDVRRPIRPHIAADQNGADDAP